MKGLFDTPPPPPQRGHDPRLRTTALESLCHFMDGYLLFYKQSHRACYKLIHAGTPSPDHTILVYNEDFPYFFFYILLIYWEERRHTMVYKWRSEDTCGSWFCPSTLRVPGNTVGHEAWQQAPLPSVPPRCPKAFLLV